MVVAGTITVKMAPRVKVLWDQMPEPKWCIAMGSCATSGDFYRDLYPVVPGVDHIVPVDVYVPGCPPNPEALMHGLLRLGEKLDAQRRGAFVARDGRPERREDEMIAAALAPSESLIARPTPPALAEDAPDAPLPEAGDLPALFRAHGATELPASAPPLIPAARHVALARALIARGHRQLVTVAASHWPAGRGRGGAAPGEPEHFEVAYALRSLGAGSKVVMWSVRAAVGESVPSLAGVLAGADWQEREQYDLVGVTFSGHPDLRRLLLPDDWEGHPLRKDHPANAPRPPWR
jgi:NADH-quinone oxidoreductase subunit B/C/D